MKINFKFLSSIVFLMVIPVSANAAQWYDRLPKSGEYVPLPTDVTSPQDFQGSNNLSVPGSSSALDSQEVVSEQSVSDKSETAETKAQAGVVSETRSGNVSLIPFVILLILLSTATAYGFFRNKVSAEGVIRK